MRVALTVGERIRLGASLPDESNFVTLKLVRRLREELSFSEEEIAEYKIVQTDTQIRWDPQSPRPEKEFDIGEKTVDIIVEALKNLDRQKRLTDQHMSLYEKFVSGNSGD